MTALEIDSVHFYPLDNAKNHHTDRFELVHNEPPSPVLRRGQEFFIAIRFLNRGYRDEADIVRLVFNYENRTAVTIGCNVPPHFGNVLTICGKVTSWPLCQGEFPNPFKGTRGVAVLSDREIYTGDRTQWDVRIKGCDETILTVEIRSPVNAPVGAWGLKVETSLVTSQLGDVRTFNYPETIFLLFNPWLKADTVYMPEQELLGEYVLNDIGKIWVGPMGTSKGREWVFGQFDGIVLPAAMMVLERTKLPGDALGDPVRVSRALSKLRTTFSQPLLGNLLGGLLGGNNQANTQYPYYGQQYQGQQQQGYLGGSNQANSQYPYYGQQYQGQQQQGYVGGSNQANSQYPYYGQQYQGQQQGLLGLLNVLTGGQQGGLLGQLPLVGGLLNGVTGSLGLNGGSQDGLLGGLLGGSSQSGGQNSGLLHPIVRPIMNTLETLVSGLDEALLNLLNGKSQQQTNQFGYYPETSLPQYYGQYGRNGFPENYLSGSNGQSGSYGNDNNQNAASRKNGFQGNTGFTSYNTGLSSFGSQTTGNAYGQTTGNAYGQTTGNSYGQTAGNSGFSG